ncbi:MAG TPA: citrate/2-methylcitrate synthase [Fimbriiglobus sp.]|jgi:citrate synthase
MSATAPANQSYSPGLEGVIAGETAISTVEGGLSYRGYPVGELAEKASFDEVAYLLLYGDLPKSAELKAFQDRVGMARRLPQAVKDFLGSMPKWAVPLDVLRSAVSALASFDQDAADNSKEANLRKSERLLAQMPVVIADYFRLNKGLQPIPARADLGTAANFLHMLREDEASADEVKALDVSLTLYAEHEFNASTFTARVIVSTMADLHAAITGAIGALKGPLHGGANEKVMDVLFAAGGPDTAEAWIRAALAKKERIMGFGHRVYKSGDVRAGILKTYAQSLAGKVGAEKWERTADIIEGVMAKEKTMYPNLDWPAGRLYHAMKLEIPLYTPMFAMSRVTGWSAHVIEQLGANRLIRPRGLYTGPARRPVVPLAERS